MASAPAPQRKMTVEMLDESKNQLEKLLTSEEELDFSNGDLDNVKICALSSLLVSGNYNVKSLILKCNDLSDELFATLVTALNYDESVEKLDLSENALTQRGMYHLLLCLSQCNETITEINLENNFSICSIGVGYIAEILSTNTHLTCLNLSGIDLERSAQILGDGIKENTTLKKLNLSSCSLGAQSLKVLIDTIIKEKSMLRLEDLNLSFNPVMDGHFEVFTPLFNDITFTLLQSLSLNFNQMMFNANNNFSKELKKAMENSLTLQKLSLQGNLFDDKDADNLTCLLKSSLVEVNLKDNNFTTEGLKVFLKEASNRSDSLKKFDIDENKFLDNDEGIKVFEKFEKLFSNEEKLRKRISIAKKKLSIRKKSLFQESQSEDERTIVFRKLKKKDSFKSDELPPIGDGSFMMKKHLKDHFTAESNLFNRLPLLEISSAMRTQLENLKKEFPQTSSPEKIQKKKKRAFKSKIAKIKDMRKEKEEGKIQPLHKSAILQRKIAQDLKRNAKLVTPSEQLSRQIEREFGGLKSLLPSVLMDELTGVFEEANLILPSAHLLEMFVKSLKMASTVTWCLLQSFVGFENSSKDLCKKVLQAFGNNLKSEDATVEKISGSEMLEGLFMQLVDALLLMKPLFSFGEALLLVMTSERTLIQPRLSFYERREERLEARAKKHMQRRAQKIRDKQKLHNMRKILKRAQEKLNEKTRKSIEMMPVDEKSEEKEEVKKEKKKKEFNESQEGTLGNKTATTTSMSEDVLRFRENCPERVEDVLDSLKESSMLLDSLLSIEGFLPSIVAFLDYDKMQHHVKYRVEGLKESFPEWFEDLKGQFKCEELEHIMPEIKKEIEVELQGFIIPEKKKKQTIQRKGSRSSRSTQSMSMSVKTMNSVRQMGLFSRFRSKIRMKKVPAFLEKEISDFESSVADEEEEFDTTLLNEICFGNHESGSRLRKLRKELDTRLAIKPNLKLNLAMEMKKLAARGTKETISLTTIRLKEKFENEMKAMYDKD